MNYSLDFSLRVEDEILRLIEQREKNKLDNPFEVEEDFYDQALNTILAEDQGRTLAAGNVRLGEIILLVDCDTRVVCIISYSYPSSDSWG